MRDSSMQNFSSTSNGSFGEEDSFIYWSTYTAPNDEVAKFQNVLDYLTPIRGKYEEICYKYVSELDAAEKKHSDQITKLHDDIKLKLNDLQDKLAKQSNEAENMQKEKNVLNTANGKLIAFLSSLYERK